jgi:hypothetical protein
MIYNKSVIRKLILLEIKNRLIFEQAAQSATPAVTFSTEEDKQNMIQGMDKLINALKGEVQTIGESEASKYEQRLYKATKEGFGFGTDEEEIERVLTEIPTIVDVSYVSAKFEKTHQGAWTFTPTLEAVFSSELDDTDMERHVNTVINDKMKTSFIRLGEFGVLGRDQFFDLIKSGKEFQNAGLGDPSAVFKGKAKGGIKASSGVLSAVDALFDDDPSTEFYIAPAVDQLAVPAAAGAAARVGGSMNPVTSAKALGGEIAGAAQGASAARTTAMGAGKKNITRAGKKAAAAAGQKAAAAGVTDVAAVAAAKKAAKEAAEAAAKRALARSALKVAGTKLLQSIPALALKAVPFLGWALFVSEMADWAVSGDIQEDTALALDSNLYLKIKDMFKQVLPGLEASRAAIAGTPVLEASEEAGTDESKSTSLGWGLEQPYVLNIIKTMNAYAAKKSLKGYTPPPEENNWSPVVQEAWLKFAPHALANCGLYSQFNISNVDNWKNMSAAMRSKYPGYTPNPRGCLAFCLDAYYCELRYGNEAPSSSSGRRTGRSRGGNTAATPGGDTTTASRESGSNNFEIKLNSTNKNFENSGFGPSGIDRIVAESVLAMRDQSAIRNGMSRTNMVLYLEVNRAGNKVIDVDAIRVDGSLGPFKNRRGQINKGVLSALNANSLTFPSSGPYSSSDKFDERRSRGKFIRLTITFFGGRY